MADESDDAELGTKATENFGTTRTLDADPDATWHAEGGANPRVSANIEAAQSRSLGDDTLDLTSANTHATYERPDRPASERPRTLRPPLPRIDRFIVLRIVRCDALAQSRVRARIVSRPRSPKVTHDIDHRPRIRLAVGVPPDPAHRSRTLHPCDHVCLAGVTRQRYHGAR